MTHTTSKGTGTVTLMINGRSYEATATGRTAEFLRPLGIEHEYLITPQSYAYAVSSFYVTARDFSHLVEETAQALSELGIDNDAYQVYLDTPIA